MDSSVLVELVSTLTVDGVTLHGGLHVPLGAPAGAIDAVLCVHGVGSSFYQPFFVPYAEALTARGIAVLRSNNRGHDIINRGDGQGRFLGAALEEIADARLDVAAWLGVLAERGYRRIVVFGHSLGAVKTALVLAHEADPRVVGAVLASPPRFNTDAMRNSARGDEFAAALGRAQTLVCDGRGDELIHATFPTASFFAARTFVSKYGRGDENDVYALAPRIDVRVLAFTGERELAEPSFADHVTGFETVRARKADLEHVVVPDGDHFYRGQSAFVSERLLRWLGAFS
jgi:pimeloyl-ACP methyl ester carboxylesterase